jgi:uncharacterized membrane protein
MKKIIIFLMISAVVFLLSACVILGLRFYKMK